MRRHLDTTHDRLAVLLTTTFTLATGLAACSGDDGAPSGGTGGQPNAGGGGAGTAGGSGGAGAAGGGGASVSTGGQGGATTSSAGGSGGGSALTDCGGQLVDLMVDADHCGACDSPCNLPANSCNGGQCSCTDTAPQLLVPLPEANAAPNTAALEAHFDCVVDATSLTSAAVVVHGDRFGPIPGSLALVGPGVVSFTPQQPLAPGETVTMIRTASLMTVGGASLQGQHRFRAAASVSMPSTLADSGQALGNLPTTDVALGDLDGDGDVDAITTNGWSPPYDPSRVWLNDGTGVFTDSGQSLDGALSIAVALGDLDGDGDLDAAIANRNGPNTIWLNDGSATFTATGQALVGANGGSADMIIGDVDNDGDLDLLEANLGSQVWLNDGSAAFTAGWAQPMPGTQNSLGGALADIDGDGDLDGLLSRMGINGAPNLLLTNDGSAVFGITQPFGGFTFAGPDPQVARLDADPWVDVIWHDTAISLGLGGAMFGSGTMLDPNADEVALGDVDGDGDLDAYVVHRSSADQLWLNAGNGTFTLDPVSLPGADSSGAAWADLDGDGDLDLFLTRGNGPTPGPNAVYLTVPLTQ